MILKLIFLYQNVVFYSHMVKNLYIEQLPLCRILNIVTGWHKQVTP